MGRFSDSTCSARLNLASFVTTWMEPECEALMAESFNINYIDEHEYPSTTCIQNQRAPRQIYNCQLQCMSASAVILHAARPVTCCSMQGRRCLVTCCSLLRHHITAPALHALRGVKGHARPAVGSHLQ